MTVQLRVRRDAKSSTPPPRHRLDWDRDPELDRFAGLSEDDKVRVIIRVLCGLVALGESSTSDGPPVVEAGPTRAPTPKRRRLLPFLGYESRTKSEMFEPADGTPGPSLPFIGLRTPLGEAAPPWTRISA